MGSEAWGPLIKKQNKPVFDRYTAITTSHVRRRRKFCGGNPKNDVFYYRFWLLEHMPGHLGRSILGILILDPTMLTFVIKI